MGNFSKTRNGGDKWSTLPVQCRGGLNINEDPLAYKPGEATALVNFEPSIFGGYRRITGYSKYEDDEVPGTGNVIGVCAAQFDTTSGIIACRGTDIFFSTGSGWGTEINPAPRTGGGKYRFTKYAMGGEQRVIMCDGIDEAAMFNGVAYTDIDGSGAPANPKFAAEFKSHIFFGGHSSDTIIFTAPNTDDDFDTANGAGEINFGDVPTGLRVFRDSLIVFCRNSIYKITGNDLSDFVAIPITRNIGCLATDSIQEINTDILFLAPDGIRTVAGTDKIGDTELGNISRKIQPIAVNILSLAGDDDNICSTVIREKSQYRLFYPSISIPAADSPGILGTFTQNGERAGWEWGEIAGIKAYCADSGMLGGNEIVVHGGFDGFVYRQELGITFDGTAISATYKTAPLFFDDPSMRKTLFKLTAFLRPEGLCNVSVGTDLDFENPDTLQPDPVILPQSNTVSVFGVAVFDTDVFSLGFSPRIGTNLIGSGKTIQFTFFSTSTADVSYSIQSFVVQYGLEGRR